MLIWIVLPIVITIDMVRSLASPIQQPRQILTCGPSSPYDSTVRASIGDESGSLYGWPSRGGVIILNDAEAIDHDFLGLDPLNPPAERDDDQDAEDAFCQRLLLLGAKWWDSEERYLFVASVEETSHGRDNSYGHGDGSFRNAKRPAPTMREKRWVKVGWPSTGGLWVSEFDTTWGGVDEDENLPPDEGLARVKLARTMDERCQILRDTFRAKFYYDVSEYEGYAFLRAWEWKFTGEVGRTMLTPQETYRQWCDSFIKEEFRQSGQESSSPQLNEKRSSYLNELDEPSNIAIQQDAGSETSKSWWRSWIY